MVLVTAPPPRLETGHVHSVRAALSRAARRVGPTGVCVVGTADRGPPIRPGPAVPLVSRMHGERVALRFGALDGGSVRDTWAKNAVRADVRFGRMAVRAASRVSLDVGRRLTRSMEESAQRGDERGR